MLEDPALDDMWKEASKDTEYQSQAKVVADKFPKKMVHTMSKRPIKKLQSVMERLSLIEKKGTRLLLMDYTLIVVPMAFREELMRRENISHSGRVRMEQNIRAKYYWPKLGEDGKEVVEKCRACQVHGSSKAWDPLRLPLECVDRPMQSVGLHFFQRGSTHYLILIDHFSGLPIFQKLNKTACKDVVKQLKSWLSLFGVSRLIRADNGPA